MPRKSKGARLWLDPSERVWIIRDAGRKLRTGCGAGETGRAEEALQRYLADKHEPVRDRRPDRVPIADVLSLYLDTVATHRTATAGYDIGRLLEWWGANAPYLSDINRASCVAYAEHRMAQPPRTARRGAAKLKRISAGTVIRELGVLKAAILAYHAEHQLSAVPLVTMPATPPARERWLTRGEAARLLRACRAHPQPETGRALARFILIGLYTGTRAGAIRDLAWMPTTLGGWVDVDSQILIRKPDGEAATRKRKPPHRIPHRLLGHLRRWRAQDKTLDAARAARLGDPADFAPTLFVVNRAGLPLASQRKAWDWVRRRAGLGADVVAHTLRHTAATWMMADGVEVWDAAGLLGMSPETLWTVYGHHHPDFQREAAARIGRRRPK